MDLIVHNEEEMLELGQALASILGPSDIVYLRGVLGAGKTVLVRGVARGLGYSGPVTSPTFTLMNVYPAVPVIYHFDFYRLETPDLVDLGLDDYLESGGISLLEWPQAGEEILPGEALGVNIELTGDDYDLPRKVHISAQGAKYQPKLERLKSIVDSGHR
ncbi:MAG: tRNA (adenosine(37)-N6)-threonylcarbamoyltransferase complex ATPase subunit type 1 TsaE [Syntrophomonadaceae bacterium]